MGSGTAQLLTEAGIQDVLIPETETHVDAGPTPDPSHVHAHLAEVTAKIAHVVEIRAVQFARSAATAVIKRITEDVQ